MTRRFTISSKSPVNDTSRAFATPGGKLSYGEAVGGSGASAALEVGRFGCAAPSTGVGLLGAAAPWLADLVVDAGDAGSREHPHRVATRTTPALKRLMRIIGTPRGCRTPAPLRRYRHSGRAS